jgi:hypothetical protein
MVNCPLLLTVTILTFNGLIFIRTIIAKKLGFWRHYHKACAVGRPLHCVVELSALRGGCAQAGVVTARMTWHGQRGRATAVARPCGGPLTTALPGIDQLLQACYPQAIHTCIRLASPARPLKIST